MILYLDMNKMIDISHDGSLLAELKEILKQKNIKLAISFSHVHETAKFENNTKIIRIVQELPHIQLSAVVRILDPG